jgi:hypothetical protein
LTENGGNALLTRQKRRQPPVPKETPMHIPALAILAITAVSAASPARAQTYDLNFPVCLHVYGPINYYECNFTTLAQCAGSASGRAAQCDINPYFARADIGPPLRHHRHHHHR